MKLLKYLLVLLAMPCMGQVKILFDASKAQMASNADWVIDADVYNLGLGLNGVMEAGQSNEAHPQRFPTPAQAGITQNTPNSSSSGAKPEPGDEDVNGQAFVMPYCYAKVIFTNPFLPA